MKYVDGYVIPVAKKHVDEYRRIAQKASKVFLEHGALEVRECVAEHMDVPFATPFNKAFKVKRGETVVFSWVAYKSRAHRDRVNEAVMKDPRMANFNAKDMPFDCERMVWGGFEVIVAT